MSSLLKRTYLFIILLMLLLSSCDLFDSRKQVIGRYYIINDKFGRHLSYMADNNGNYLNIVDDNFTGVGHDNNYIIVEINIPVKDMNNNRPNYFIVPIYQTFTYSPEKGILGPLNLNTFNKQKEVLKIKADFPMMIK